MIFFWGLQAEEKPAGLSAGISGPPEYLYSHQRKQMITGPTGGRGGMCAEQRKSKSNAGQVIIVLIRGLFILIPLHSFLQLTHAEYNTDNLVVFLGR
jgi:hypothetical protein